MRGVAAASFDGGTAIEVYTGETTVTVVGDDPEVVQGAVEPVPYYEPGEQYPPGEFPDLPDPDVEMLESTTETGDCTQ